MNQKIKNGAEQLAEGVMEEAKKFAKDAKGKAVDIKSKLDVDNDGKVDVNDLKDSFDKLSALLKDEDLPAKVKDDISDVVEKIRPKVEAVKMEAEIKKEKIEAEIAHIKEVKETKEEVLNDGE
jgi:hypothetical protein